MSDNWMRRCTRRRPHCAPRSRWLCAGCRIISFIVATMKEMSLIPAHSHLLRGAQWGRRRVQRRIQLSDIDSCQGFLSSLTKYRCALHETPRRPRPGGKMFLSRNARPPSAGAGGCV